MKTLSMTEGIVDVPAVETELDPRPLTAAIEAANQENYLGATTVVDGIVRTFLSELAEKRIALITGLLPSKQFEEWGAAECYRLADVFLGNNPDYPGMSEWNRPGGIDVWLNGHFPGGFEATDPRERLASFFAMQVSEFLDLANFVDEGALPEQWQPGMNDLVRETTNAMLGIPFVETE